MTPPHIAIIGAGLSGSACAQMLAAAGYRVTVFDKSRGSGGRLASKRIDDHVMNLGAQSFSARSSEFSAQLDAWMQSGLLVKRGDSWWPTANTSQLTRDLLRDVEFITATRIESIAIENDGAVLIDASQQHHGPFAAAIVSAPPLQAAQLVASIPQLSTRCGAATLAPAWVAVFRAPHAWKSAQVLPPALTHVLDREHNGAHYWTVEAAAAWSQMHIERDPQWVGAELAALLECRDLELLHCHRWRFARVAQSLAQPYLWRAPLGICGDWLGGIESSEHGAEAAWQSGRALAQALRATDLIRR